MKRTGAWLTTYALEQVGVTHTFGIPGVHVTELYDELNRSKKIEPVLVTHEGCGAFMADGISRTTDSIGTLVVVPAAGLTHAMSGIGEAYLDGIPLLVISGGTRRDTGKSFQLHELDHQALMAPLTKKTYCIRAHEDIVPTIYDAYKTAVSGCPGPVYIEIPVEIQLFKGEVTHLPEFETPKQPSFTNKTALDRAITAIKLAEKPGIFAGWGARHASRELIALAELLDAPVATTLQGLSVFPNSHPLHTGMGFSEAAVPSAYEAFKDRDCLIAIGTRFGEIPTGSYGIKPPESLIHIDIDPDVFNKNYPAHVTLQGDSHAILKAMVNELQKSRSRDQGIKSQILTHKSEYRQEWLNHASGARVNPIHLFDALKQELGDDAYYVVDDGNHTFLAAELMEIEKSRHFISPTDFNCMGYAVPASIGVKMTHPRAPVACIVGDGAFMMTSTEIVTAVQRKLGVLFVVFNDGELSQISQGQEIPYNRKTCTILSKIDFEGVAKATGAAYFTAKGGDDLGSILKEAHKLNDDGKSVVLDVAIDYSKETRFTRGVVKTNLSRFPIGEKLRFVGRALTRKVTG